MLVKPSFRLVLQVLRHAPQGFGYGSGNGALRVRIAAQEYGGPDGFFGACRLKGADNGLRNRALACGVEARIAMSRRWRSMS